MNARRWKLFSLLLTGSALFLATPSASHTAERVRPPVHAGSVLKTVFEPTRGNRLKSRSLMQRSFLDTIGNREQPMQVAFVIDGTDSMGTDIQGVLQALRSMISDLQRHKTDQAKVEFGLVVYRDVESPSGVVEFPLGKKFTTDFAELEEAISKVKTESGAPYFEEAVDVGLHEAMTSLPWNTDAKTVHWSILFTDAPPYPEGFVNGTAKRVYSNDELLQSAKDANMVVHSVLCSSGYSQEAADINDERRQKLLKSYENSLPSNRAFLENLAQKTQGVLLDLSKEDIVSSLVKELERSEIQYQAVEMISAVDIDAVRTKTAAAKTAKIAVLPHLPLNAMKFDAELPEVQVAAQWREKLRLLPAVEVHNPDDVAQAYERLKSLGLEDRELIHKLASDLHLDYVIGGSLKTEGKESTLGSVLYRRVSDATLAKAESLVTVNKTIPIKDDAAQNNLLPSIADDLLEQAKDKLKSLDINDGLSQAHEKIEDTVAIAKSFAAPFSEQLRASREMTSGLDSLERALAYERGNPKGLEHLNRAKLKLGAALLIDPENPLAHAWLATVNYNLASEDPSDQNIAEYQKSLQSAYELVTKSPESPYRSLIEAQHALVLAKDAARAIQLYQSLLGEKGSASLDLRLKAHWMLVGIYAGDWGVPAEQKNPTLAREHVIQILANWPDSQEAAFLKDTLRWDDNDGSLHPHLPLENSSLALKR